MYTVVNFKDYSMWYGFAISQLGTISASREISGRAQNDKRSHGDVDGVAGPRVAGSDTEPRRIYNCTLHELLLMYIVLPPTL